MTPDLAIIGAGPAGLGAAIEARAAGLSVVLIDDQMAPGGQIWRGAGQVPGARRQLMGPDYAKGRAVIDAFHASGATYLPGHVAWNIEAEPLAVDCAGPEGSRRIRPGTLLLATGAVERPVPVPGWTLPGVQTAGGLQILMKTSGLAAEGAVLAGAGPLLWLLAAQMAAAGVPPQAVVETLPAGRYREAARALPGALRAPGPLAKGLGLIAKVLRAGVAVHRGASGLQIEGTDRAEAVRFRDAAGRDWRLETQTVGLHLGVVPNPQAPRLLRIGHDWDAGQAAFRPRRDGDLRLAPGILMAGDGAGIGGAEVAELEGRLAARLLAGGETAGLRRRIARARAARPFLERLYHPGTVLPDDGTVVCRCENVTAGAIRRAARDGAAGPNQAKFLLRAGMGPCQGRTCGLAVAALVAEARGQGMQETGYFRIRPPLKPLPLSVIAAAGMAEPDFPPP
ncbi:NAD(P)/FAD-dependent oxidoreductase [Poseidonocella sp. HB161398]|uniref:FAD/NAD(P)-dependent oxidoreductase n=1 Tax=Poseidonocella sp. HB161398 TaxID=2320855 RepID=UPI001109A5A6|nr:NAD(P)/FAD-dependent oxidoreductase [Poseidonocella sp. HB161398]